MATRLRSTGTTLALERPRDATPDVPPALDHPTFTAAERLAPFVARMGERRTNRPETVTVPGVDVAALQAAADPSRGNPPMIHRATFSAPLGVSWATYQGIRDTALQRFIDTMHRKGYDLVADTAHRLRVDPGVYPAHDLLTGLPMLDRREFVALVWFRWRSTAVIRWEIDPALTQPMTVRRSG